MDRRDVLKAVGGTFLAGASCASAFSFLISKTSGKVSKPTGGAGDGVVSSQKTRWGMAIDLNKCNACQECNGTDELPRALDDVPCVTACRQENHTYHGERREDYPYNIFWIRRVRIEQEADTTSEPKFAVLMCNHCDNPPCAQVCPVQATYKRKTDGVVIVDHHRCIGCRYCMIACPYNARWFNFKENEVQIKKYKDNDGIEKIPQPKRSHGVAESCTFCAHIIGEWKRLNDVVESIKEEDPEEWAEKNPELAEWAKENPAPVPACVKACEEACEEGERALTFGNLENSESELSRLIAKNAVKRLRDDLGTKPKVYYIGFPPKDTDESGESNGNQV